MLPQKILGFITYSREELLDIRASSTHQHYDQEYDFPEAEPLFSLTTQDNGPDPSRRPKTMAP